MTNVVARRGIHFHDSCEQEKNKQHILVREQYEDFCLAQVLKFAQMMSSANMTLALV